MSVYISGVEMPKEHPLYITLRPDGSVHVWDSYSGGGYGTQAIPVPEHGRLGDFDELKKVVKGNNWSNPTVPTAVNAIIARMPTIIPASTADKEGEG